MKLIGIIVLALPLLAQTTRYPGAIDNDSSLFVVADNVQSSLNAAMATTDTAIVLQSGAGFVPNMIASICDSSTTTGKCTSLEHMLITAVNGNLLTVTRGFAGTTAKAHNAGLTVSALIDAAHQKVLKDSVTAIETALGPNLGNIVASGIPVQKYNFAPQAPGGTLPSGTCSFVMNPVPPGVVAGGELYLTNPSEVVSITGIVGNTVNAACSNSHSGGWTVQSLSGGWGEAWAANGGGYTYLLPPGQIDLYGTLNISLANGQSAIFKGSSYGTVGFPIATSGGTTVVAHGSGDALHITGLQGQWSGQMSFRDFRVTGNATTTNVLECTMCQAFEMENVTLDSAGTVNGNGLYCSGCIFITIRHSLFALNNGSGAVFVQQGTGGGTYIIGGATRVVNNCENSNQACAGILINGAYTVTMDGVSFEGSNSVFTGSATPAGGYGLYLLNSFGINITGSYCERNRTACIGLFQSRGFEISGNAMLDSGLYIDSTSLYGSIHGNSFYGADTVAINVSGAVANGPLCQITTSTPHGLVLNTTVYLTGIGGATACNGPAKVTSVQSASQFTIDRVFGAAYTSGGTAQQLPGLVVPVNQDIRVWGNDDIAAPGIYTTGISLLRGIGAGIASAATIAPIYELHHVTGNAAISNITPPTSVAYGFQGTFCAIPDGAFTTTATGNIAIASTAVVGRTLCFTYDPAAIKWMPSY